MHELKPRPHPRQLRSVLRITPKTPVEFRFSFGIALFRRSDSELDTLRR